MTTTPTLFAGGLLFDGIADPRPDFGVLVAGGRIHSVAPLESFAGFDGPRVDTSDGTLMPGLVDAHVHLALEAGWDPAGTLRSRAAGDMTLRMLENAQATLAGGVTAARDLGGVDWLEVGLRDAIAAGRQAGPTLRCVGMLITITGGHGSWMGLEADGPDAFRAAVRRTVKHGADCIKLIATGGVLTPRVDPRAAHPTVAELRAAVEMAHDFGLRVAVHAQGATGIRRAVEAGADSIEHGFELDDELVGLMNERGVWLSGTLASMHHLVANLDRVPAQMRAKVERWHEAHFASFTRFARAGGKVALGTDAGTPGNRHGGNALELALMVKLGMTPLAALRAGTVSTADLLDLPDRGRIAEGAAADLLLVSGNPAEDIAMAADRANHRGVWKGGRKVEPAPAIATGPLFVPAAAAGF